MTMTRRSLAPLVVGVVAILALIVPGTVGAKGTPIVGLATGSTGPTGPGGLAPSLSASMTACHADPLQANRYAIFASQMTSLPGTRTMAVDFELQERSSKNAVFATVTAPGFGVWVTSQPGVGIYTYDHEVTSLPAPAAFRVLVRARWLDRRRGIIHRQELISPVCTQPLEMPNLAVETLRRAPGSQAGTVVYSVAVLNAGSAAAGAFQVSLTVNGVALPAASVAGLAAGAAQVVQISGPSCAAGSTLTAAADPGGAVSEPVNPARTRVFPCTR
jgi:hypothetical protein